MKTKEIKLTKSQKIIVVNNIKYLIDKSLDIQDGDYHWNPYAPDEKSISNQSTSTGREMVNKLKTHFKIIACALEAGLNLPSLDISEEQHENKLIYSEKTKTIREVGESKAMCEMIYAGGALNDEKGKELVKRWNMYDKMIETLQRAKEVMDRENVIEKGAITYQMISQILKEAEQK